MTSYTSKYPLVSGEHFTLVQINGWLFTYVGTSFYRAI